MQQADPRWRRAIQSGKLGVWDLRPELETVHHSPQWKQRLGFPEPYAADNTHFWRCRVHPDDLEGMLGAMRAHVQGSRSCYEARFRLRSNGSGYRVVYSRGRVIERDAAGRALRTVGTMIDLTNRQGKAGHGLPDGPRGPMQGRPLELPFHLLLSVDGFPNDIDDVARARIAAERERVFPLVEDLLRATLEQLAETDFDPEVLGGAAENLDWLNG